MDDRRAPRIMIAALVATVASCVGLSLLPAPANALAAPVPALSDSPLATRGATSIATPHGRAFQRLSRDALDLRSEVAGGRQVFRGGNFGRSAAGEGQFFSVESPLSPGFADRVGAATLGRGTPDFVIGGTVRPGAGLVTRRAPPFGKNAGGALEVVTEPGAVRLDFFHMP